MPLHAGSSSSSTSAGARYISGSRHATPTRTLSHPRCPRSPADRRWLAGLPGRLRCAGSPGQWQRSTGQPCRQGQRRLYRISCSAQSSKSQAAALTRDAASRAEDRERRKAASARNHRVTMVRRFGSERSRRCTPSFAGLAAAVREWRGGGSTTQRLEGAITARMCCPSVGHQRNALLQAVPLHVSWGAHTVASTV